MDRIGPPVRPDVKVIRAALYKGQLHYGDGDDAITPLGDPIFSISREDFPPSHDIAVTLSWMVDKVAEDHPMTGCSISLVRPDQSVSELGSIVIGTWGQSGGDVPIQALDLPEPGRYIVEIRPAILTGETTRDPRTSPTGTHRLASLCLEVL